MTDLPPGPAMGALGAAPKVSPDSVLATPRTPVTRWNRRYILAGGGVLAGLIAFGFYIGFGGAHRSQPKADPNPPAIDVTPTPSGLADRYPRGYGDPAVQAAAGPGTASLPPPGLIAVGGQVPAPSPAPVDPAVQQAQQQALAARAAGPFFQTGGPSGVAAAPPGPASPTFAAAAPSSGPGGETLAPDVQPANGQGAKRQFLASARADDYLAGPLRAPVSPWEVKAGTVISAALVTALNSDLPGEIVAQVTEPVYDHVSGRTVLIPQGSRLIGQYDSQVAYGQERALIAWNRIVMPDGRSINIGAMGGGDLSGASGLKDRVDGHVWQLARGILLSTVFSVGAASAQDASSRSSGGFVLNSAGTGVSAQAQQVGQQITQRDLNRQPTLTVRAGWPLRVLVNKDMILAPYP
jgi:type IV secretion system protein VirB10